MKPLLLLAASLALPGVAAAHDLTVQRAPQGFVLRYGDPGERFPIDARKLRSVRCWDASGSARELLPDAAVAPTEVRFPGTCSAVSVFLDGGAWSLTPDGEVNRPKGEVQGVVRSWASRQYAKWVDARSPRAGAVLGDELELVPVTDLARRGEGDEVTLRVLSAGSPVRGAPVEMDDRVVGETDSKGELRLRLRGGGTATVATSVKRPHATAQADSEVLEATLTFEVAR